MNKEYPTDLWFIKFKKGKSFWDNFHFNVSGIIGKMRFVNVLRIWCREDFSPTTEAIIQQVLAGGGWKKLSIKRKEDAKDLKGKKFKINIVEIKIKRTDSNWLPK